MKKINATQLKEIQLQILTEVDFFCKAKNIKYCLAYGTLIGAIRHKGYIPWDDDIDIVMLRPDFERFISSFSASNSRYKVICNELQSDCYYPFAKVLDTKTVLYEPDENGVKLCVNIDLFAYDAVPDRTSGNKLNRKLAKFNFLNVVQFKLYRSKKWYKRIPKLILHHILKLYPKGYFASKIVKNARKYEEIGLSQYVGGFTSVGDGLCDRSVFDSYILKEFEGREYPVPIGYDVWLTAIYGDYMQLPPVEKRITHHTFKAYIDENA